MPSQTTGKHPRLLALIERAQTHAPVTTAIVYPCEASALKATMDAAAFGLIRPVLYGPVSEMQAIARKAELELAADAIDFVECGASPVDAARRAVADAAGGAVQALMKGSLHSDELLGAVLARDGGLRGTRRLTHTFAFDVPRYHKLLGVTDAVVNINPDLRTKTDAAIAACDVFRRLGVAQPKLAVVTAIETVNQAIPATLDARELVHLAGQGAFGDAIVEGPFGFDNAISAAAARTKGLDSRVAGDPDILLVPDLNAGNILYKSLVYLGGAECAGVVLGARVPVVLTSRADSAFSRIASCALANILALDQA